MVKLSKHAQSIATAKRAENPVFALLENITITIRELPGTRVINVPLDIFVMVPTLQHYVKLELLVYEQKLKKLVQL